MSKIGLLHGSELYKNAPVYLWVEDEETRTYLDAAWGNDDTIGILVAGGCENIAAVVHAARNDGLSHVFGYRDRDFGESNCDLWSAPPNGVFVMKAFEIENLLLDPEAMTACRLKTSLKTSVDFRNEMKALASKFDWWMACRQTIVDLRAVIGAQFIEHPNHAKVATFDQARDVIASSTWWRDVRPSIVSKVELAHTENLLKKHYAAYNKMLDSDEWKSRFSGKEVLLEMRGRVWTRKQKADPEGRRDFYKAIGEAQLSLGSVPEEIIKLKKALRAQAGR